MGKELHLVNEFDACCSVVDMALAFVSVFCWPAVVFSITKFCITVVGLVWSNFLCPWSLQLIFVILVCAFTCARSFVLGVWGVLLIFRLFLVFFSLLLHLLLVLSLYFYFTSIFLFFYYYSYY